MDQDKRNFLRKTAAEIRQDIVCMHQRGTNVASAMSAADILAVLYFDILHISDPDDEMRDCFILSKGHAAAALYSVLAKKGFIEAAMLSSYFTDNSPLTSHPSLGSLPGVEASTGSLGHGLPMAVGLAHAAKMDARPNRVFVLHGDGELQEGSVWEGAVLASRLKLDNLTVIVDANGLQGYDRVEELMPVSSIAPKWQAFGWEVCEVDGHDHTEISRVLTQCPFMPGKPSAVIAHTVKGKGIREMEDRLGWHYFSVPPDKVEQFLDELEKQK